MVRRASDAVVFADTLTKALARLAAFAYCQGTPLRHEIEARAGADLVAATSACGAAIAARFGTGAVDAKIQAQVVSVRR